MSPSLENSSPLVVVFTLFPEAVLVVVVVAMGELFLVGEVFGGGRWTGGGEDTCCTLLVEDDEEDCWDTA